MKLNHDFTKTINLSITALLLSGIQLTNKIPKFWTSNWLNIFYISAFWLYTDVLAELIWVIDGMRAGKDFEELTYIAPCIAVSVLGTSKCYYIIANINVVKEVIEKFRNLHENLENELYDDNDERVKTFEINIKNYETNNGDINNQDAKEELKEKKVFEGSIKILQITMKFIGLNCIIVVVAFTCMPLMFMLVNLYQNGVSDIKYPLLCNYLILDSNVLSPVVPIIYLKHVISVIIAALNVYGSDSLFYIFCGFTQMHFRILKVRMANVFHKDLQEGKLKLAKLVLRHQELIDIVNKMQLIYSKSTLVNFIMSSFLICLSGFNVLTIKDPGPVLSFFTFLCFSLVQIFMLCFCGDLIMRTSTDIGESIFKSLWYNADQDLKKNVFIIIFRSQKPCKVTAENFVDVNLGAFTTVLSRSWSYFALLNTMYN